MQESLRQEIALALSYLEYKEREGKRNVSGLRESLLKGIVFIKEEEDFLKNELTSTERIYVFIYMMRFRLTHIPKEVSANQKEVSMFFHAIGSALWSEELNQEKVNNLFLLKTLIGQNDQYLFFQVTDLLAQGVPLERLGELVQGKNKEKFIKSIRYSLDQDSLEKRDVSYWIEDKSVFSAFLRLLLGQSHIIEEVQETNKGENLLAQPLYLSQIDVLKEKWKKNGKKEELISWVQDGSIGTLPLANERLDEMITYHLIQRQREAGLYTLEFVQNALDATPKEKELQINISVYQTRTHFCEEIQDNSQGPCDIFDLLSEGVGSKYDKEDLLGRFGIGSFTYFYDCDEVELESHHKGGMSFLRLICQADGKWQLVEMRKEVSNRRESGMILRRKKKLTHVIADIEASCAYQYWYSFAKILKPEIYFSWGVQSEKELISQKVEEVYESPYPLKVPTQLIKLPKNCHYQPTIVNKGRLYMKEYDIDSPYLKKIPKKIKRITHKRAISDSSFIKNHTRSK